jgi:hypothetical protein
MTRLFAELPSRTEVRSRTPSFRRNALRGAPFLGHERKKVWLIWLM